MLSLLILESPLPVFFSVFGFISFRFLHLGTCYLCLTFWVAWYVAAKLIHVDQPFPVLFWDLNCSPYRFFHSHEVDYVFCIT